MNRTYSNLQLVYRPTYNSHFGPAFNGMTLQVICSQGVFWDSLQLGVETKLLSVGFSHVFSPKFDGFLMFSVTFCPDFQRQGPRGWSPVIALKIRRVEIQETHHVNHPFNGHDEKEPIDWRYRFHICLAYLSGLCKGISPQNMPLYGTVPPF
jgi:hypothetical protein